MKREFTAMEKLVAVKTALEAFGIDVSAMTVSEAFDMWSRINTTIKIASRDLEVLN